MDSLTIELEDREAVGRKLTEVIRAEAQRNFDWDVAARVTITRTSVDVIFPGPLEGERIRDAGILEGFIVANVRYALAKYERELA